MQYMRAHGNSVGPTHRPLLTGLLTGIIAAAPSLAVAAWSGALASEAEAFGMDNWAAAVLNIIFYSIFAAVYALVFKRAANDMCGGWLLGISYGFLLWVIGPVTAWNWVMGEPLATGTAAMGTLAAGLTYGLALGGLFPWVNRITQSRMD